MSKTHKSLIHQNQLAAVGYIPLLNLLLLFSSHRNRFIVAHALSGVLLSAYFFISYFWIPEFGRYLALLFAALLMGGFIHAARGEKYPLPLIHDFVEWLAKLFDKKIKVG